MRLSRVVLVAAFLFLAAAPVRAQTIFTGLYTGGNAFNTTASITLSYSDLTGGVYMYTLNVMNEGIYGEVYKAIGLFNLPASYALVSSTSSLSGWHLPPPNDLSGGGLTPETLAYITDDPAPKKGLQVGQGVTFTFTLSGFTSLAQVTSVGAGIHAISGPNDCSTKLGVQNGAVVQRAPGAGDCSTVVPEPATTVLLGTGLLGLLGFGVLRRRQGLPLGRVA